MVLNNAMNIILPANPFAVIVMPSIESENDFWLSVSALVSLVFRSNDAPIRSNILSPGSFVALPIKRIVKTTAIATLEKICNGFWIPENIRVTVNVDARVLQKV